MRSPQVGLGIRDESILLQVGYCFVASALLVVLGNFTGWFPTFPYAGAALGMVGSSLIARGLGVRQRYITATEERGYSVITLAFLASWRCGD